MGNFSKPDGRLVEFEIIKTLDETGEDMRLEDTQYEDAYRIEFTYRVEDGDDEYKWIEGPFSSEGDIEQAIMDFVEAEGSP